MKRCLLGVLILLGLGTSANAANYCYVTELQARLVSGVQVAIMPPLVDQPQLSVSAVAAASAAFGASTSMIRISCDTTVSAAFGSNPTATVNNMRIPANVPEYFYVSSGQKVSFITNQ